MTDTGPLPPLPPAPPPAAVAAFGFPIPDIRGWFVIGSFGIVVFLLVMIQDNPKLLALASFMQLATVIVGLLVVVGNNLFGGTKVGSETMATQAAAVVRAANNNAPIQPVDTTTTTTVKSA